MRRDPEQHPAHIVRLAAERRRLNGGHTVLPAPEPEAPAPEPARATIRIQGGRLPEIVAEAADALGRAALTDPFRGYYRRGNLLVRTTRLADEGELAAAGVRRQRGALVIAAADPDALRVALTAVAQW